MAFEMFMYRVPRGTYLGVCPLSSSKLPDHHLRNLSTSTSTYPASVVILSSRHSSVYTTSVPPLVPNRSTISGPLPLAVITAGTFFSTTTPSQYEPGYTRDKTLNRHYLAN
jgi:hypothetical protein